MALEQIEKLELILDWADDNPDFDTAFVEELYDCHEHRGHLTDRQEEALDNIIEKFKIQGS